PHAVIGPEMLALADMPGVLDEAAMLELHALRCRGGPGRIENVGHVFGCHRVLAGVEGVVADLSAHIPEVLERNHPARALIPDGHDAPELGQSIRAGPADLAEHGEVVLTEKAVDGDEGSGV